MEVFKNERNLLLLGVKVLLQGNAELLTEGLQLLEVLLVLALGVDLGLDACGVMWLVCGWRWRVPVCAE